MGVSSKAAGYTLTDESGASHKSFGKAVQPEGVRDVVVHEGDVHDPYSRAHPALLVPENECERATARAV